MNDSGQPQTPPALPPAPIAYETGWASQLVWSFCSREKSVDPAVIWNRLFGPWPPYCADYATIKACRQHQLAAVGTNHTAERHVARCDRRLRSCHLHWTSGITVWNQISKAFTCECNLLKAGCDKSLDWLKRAHVTLQISKWLPLRALIVC